MRRRTTVNHWPTLNWSRKLPGKRHNKSKKLTLMALTRQCAGHMQKGRFSLLVVSIIAMAFDV